MKAENEAIQTKKRTVDGFNLLSQKQQGTKTFEQFWDTLNEIAALRFGTLNEN